MSVSVSVYTPDEWRDFSAAAHKLVFKTYRSPDVDRVSYALVAHTDKNAIGFVTCRELDNESVYWQFGGCLDEFRGLYAVRGFNAFLDYCRERYNRISTLVKNDNVNYLHLLMKMGFRAIGLRVFEGDIFLEMFWRK